MTILLVCAIILILAGLVGIGSIVFSKIPTLLKLPENPQFSAKQTLAAEMKNRLEAIKYSSYQPLILNWLEKVLRKARIFILKADNLFIDWIGSARERSQVWTIRSKAWMEHRRLKKKEKSQVLEALDKAEISHELEKIKAEVAKEEDKAFQEKMEVFNSENSKEKQGGDFETEESPVSPDEPIFGPDAILAEEEKKCIDAIAQNPKDMLAYRTLGFIYLKQKNYSDARACFRQILKIDPRDSEVLNKLEEIKGLRNKKPAELANSL